MAAKRDLYEVLGISKTADEKAIKKAYRKLAKKYHPDMNPGDKTAEQKFKEATDAYNILSDPEKRKLYDQYGHAAFDGTGAESEFYKNYRNYGGNHGGYQEFHFEGGDGDDIFGDIFGSMFGGGGSSKGFHQSSFHQGGFGSSDGFGGSGFGNSGFGRGSLNRKVPMHMRIFLSVLMKQLQAAIKLFIYRMKMAGHSHCRFTFQPELIQEKVSA